MEIGGHKHDHGKHDIQEEMEKHFGGDDCGFDVHLDGDGDEMSDSEREFVEGKLRQSIKEDSNFYNAGFSINAEKRKLKGNVEWGHVMTATDLYYKEFDGNSLQDLIWNWINGSGTTKYINNN